MANTQIQIRRAEVTDAEAVWRCFMTPLVVRNTLQTPYRSLESVREQLVRSGENDYPLVAVVNGEVVGMLGLHIRTKPRVRHVADIGMMVRDDWQGQGVGSALMEAAVDLADKWLHLVRLELSVFVDNEPGLALYKKFGFEIEGTQRKAAFREGSFVDVYLMGRVRE